MRTYLVQNCIAHCRITEVKGVVRPHLHPHDPPGCDHWGKARKMTFSIITFPLIKTVRIISSQLLTIVAEEGIWRCTTSVPQGVPVGLVQYTASIVIRLSRIPMSERAVALVGPFPVISEQTDPKSGRWCLISIKHFLDSLIFRLVPHTGQVSAALPAEVLGSSPRHVCMNNRHQTGTVVFKFGKMERVKCVELILKKQQLLSSLSIILENIYISKILIYKK